MRELEDELRHMLRREQPPAGFAERVMRRVAEAPVHKSTRPSIGRSSVTWWAAAAALVAALGAGVEYQVAKAREERARGEAAKQDVMKALRIAGSKLHIVQSAVKESGS